MKATVVRSGSHQGVAFSEVQEFNDAGLPGPLTYAVPGEFAIGTQLNITIEDLGVPAEAPEAAPKTKAETKAEADAKKGK